VVGADGAQPDTQQLGEEIAMNFDEQRRDALAILNHAEWLTRKAGSFLGQCAVDETPLTDRQETWFEQLAERAGLRMEQTE
jgi:hypothetical protein